MNDIMANLFGPLSKDYCMYYYFMAVIMAVIFAMTLVSIIIGAFKAKKLSARYFFVAIYALFPVFISYFLSRLMYSICIKAL